MYKQSKILAMFLLHDILIFALCLFKNQCVPYNIMLKYYD